MKSIITLKNEVKRLAEHGRAIAHEIRKSSGLDRYHLWNEKRSIGTDARYALLAYACIRGVPYERVEARCGAFNNPSATRVFDVMVKALDEDIKASWSPEPVRAWLMRRQEQEAHAA